MPTWREHNCSPQHGDIRAPLRGWLSLSPNPQQASKQAREARLLPLPSRGEKERHGRKVFRCLQSCAAELLKLKRHEVQEKFSMQDEEFTITGDTSNAEDAAFDSQAGCMSFRCPKDQVTHVLRACGGGGPSRGCPG